MRSTPSDPPAGSGPVLLAFGEHELRLDSGELFRAGTPVKLQPQPAKVLEALARRAGEVVSREEIQAQVWGESTFLDADANLNFCIKQIRRALDDPAASPRYIETIPRRGYRFMVPVEARPSASPVAASGTEAPLEISPPRPQLLHRVGLATAAAGMALLALFAAAQRVEPPRGVLAARPRATPVPEAAREHYRTALYLSSTDPERAIEKLRQAILLAPRYAEAHAQLAWEESEHAPSLTGVLPDLEITARRAVELDPHLGLAHLALGKVLWEKKLDWHNGEAELRRAVELDPGNAHAWHLLGKLLASRGEHEEAIAAVRQARALDPAEMLVNTDFSWFYYLGRHYDEAVRQATSTLALKESRAGALTATDDALFRWAWRIVLNSSLRTGDRRTAIEAARSLMTAYGDPAAAKKLVRIEDYWPWEREHFLNFDDAAEGLAANAAATGQTDLALTYLEAVCRRKQPGLLIVAAADPLFDPLHGHPRFERFLVCIGVPADAPARRR